MGTTLNLQTPSFRAAPRAAAVLGSTFATVLRFLSAPARAERYNVQFSVEQARAVANQWAEFDPRAAAELRAAADRYEQTQSRA